MDIASRCKDALSQYYPEAVVTLLGPWTFLVETVPVRMVLISDYLQHDLANSPEQTTNKIKLYLDAASVRDWQQLGDGSLLLLLG
jgi:hypothetical protein